MTQADERAFHELILDVQARPISRNGEYIIAANNKLVYTVGDAEKFRIRGIVEIDVDNEQKVDAARNRILLLEGERTENEHDRKYDDRQTREILADMYGAGTVRCYRPHVYKADAWENGYGKGRNGRSFYEGDSGEVRGTSGGPYVREEQAIQYFGVTKAPKMAGFVTVGGKMLDFVENGIPINGLKSNRTICCWDICNGNTLQKRSKQQADNGGNNSRYQNRDNKRY